MLVLARLCCYSSVCVFSRFLHIGPRSVLTSICSCVCFVVCIPTGERSLPSPIMSLSLPVSVWVIIRSTCTVLSTTSTGCTFSTSVLVGPSRGGRSVQQLSHTTLFGAMLSLFPCVSFGACLEHVAGLPTNIASGRLAVIR